ncbi:ABC transporter permease [Lederbergia lenta]|uniref:Binding-protein-dependent transport systems inner membrane component n=1 Tax=Lederbergia lenta TaxID=1467 RepID=A0A2X4WQ39_LEDLE|nr:ABC transporter permease [Lederbergia lenta]MCM3110406.1 ABC transporter permease [Lederbergia lenta]MEC2324027.1 ABC transporter permease [Lederbergia lenta]SQI60792.1 binding-protein-dependent transport systems inner membrane component [Lederbergia lenta]
MESLMNFFNSNGNDLLMKTWEHLYISIAALILGIIVAIPLGILLARLPKIAGFVMGVAGVIQTFPSLAILAFFIPLLGIGKIPAIFALFLYSVLPILRNTYTGVKGVDEKLLEAGRGMGMTSLERIFNVEIPLAIPVIMAGVRLSSVYLIGWATLASFIGGGGLGDFIFDGLNLFQTDLVIAGAVPVTILALITDFLLGRLEYRSTPKGIRKQNEMA